MATATTSESRTVFRASAPFLTSTAARAHEQSPGARPYRVHPSGHPSLHPSARAMQVQAGQTCRAGAGRFASRHAVRARTPTGPAGERTSGRTDHATGIWPRRRAPTRHTTSNPRSTAGRWPHCPKKAVAADDDDVRAGGRGRPPTRECT